MASEEEVEEVNNESGKIEFEKCIIDKNELDILKKKVIQDKVLYFYIDIEENRDSIIKKSMKSICIYIESENKVYEYISKDIIDLKDVFENKDILKCSYDLFIFWQKKLVLSHIILCLIFVLLDIC